MNTSKKGPLIDGGTCRCCGVTKKCRLLNVEYEFCGQKEIYFEMFVDCFGLVLSHLEGEEKERLICATCVMRLRDACAFRQQVLQWEEKLLQLQMQVQDDDNSTKQSSKIDIKIELEDSPDMDNDNDMPESEVIAPNPANLKMYKVVETIECGKTVFTSVPSSWERDGILKWPKRNKAEKFKNHERPSDDWEEINCVVRKRRLLTFMDAENEIKKICQKSENADVQTQIEMKRKQLYSSTQKRYPKDVSTSNASEKISTENSDIIEVAVNAASQQSRKKSKEVNDTILNLTSLLNENTASEVTQLSNQIENIETYIKDIAAKMKKVLDNHKILFYNQDNMMIQLEQLSLMFQEFVARTIEPGSATIGSEVNTIEFLPVKSEEDLDLLEDKLREPEFRAELEKKFSVLCGKENGRGIHVAYRLIDYMFDRHFLTQCSWSGGSRVERRKICFKAYKHTIEFFFKAILASDDYFTLDACETFLKTILKNSMSRSMNANIRQSAPKRKIKGIKRKKDLEGESSSQNISLNDYQDDDVINLG